jgi:regulatory protein
LDKQVEKAVEQALKFLKYSDRTVHEMKEKLRGKGFAETVVDEAVRKLKRLGYLDDGRFAEKWIRGKLRSRPIGRRLIETQLRFKGIHPDVVREHLEPLYEEFTQSGGIEELAVRRLRRHKSIEGPELRKKLYDFLLRRGFDYDECSSAVQHAISSSGRTDS